MLKKQKLYKSPIYLAPRQKNNTYQYQYIPKKIFQTGESNLVSKGMYDAVHTWIDKNPDWEYHFFDNKACRYFIKDNFPKRVLDAYDNLIPGAYKADLWRYCVLYVYGGLYVDNKCELLAKNLNDVIPKDVEFLSLQEMGPLKKGAGFLIMQSFLCAKAHHKFLEKVIEVVVENVRIGYYGYTALCPTGPRALGKAIKLVLNVKKYAPNYLGNNYISGFNFILWPDKYLHKHQKYSGWLIGYDKNANPIIRHESFDYRANQASISDHIYDSSYRVFWLFDKIYAHGKIHRPYYNVIFKKYYLVCVLIMARMFIIKGNSLLKGIKIIFMGIKKKPSYWIFCFFNLLKFSIKTIVRSRIKFLYKKS